MDPPPCHGIAIDPSKCRKMSIAEKREVVHELSKWPESASEKLQSWSRRDLIDILCAEMGKERKFTGVTKPKLIESIFKVISDKNSGKSVDDMDLNPPPSPSDRTPSKRQRKTDHPLRLSVETNNHSDDVSEVKTTRSCENLVCRANLSAQDGFCKRCSCCICHKFDDNKDPSLWLICHTEYRSQSGACGASCHVECLLKHEKAGILKNGKCEPLDGFYYCIHCGNVNDLLGFLKKQFKCAKDARRVDVLCQRVSLCHRILQGTEKHQGLLDIVDKAMKKLEAEVGPFSGLPSIRGIVNRLPIGAEVQRLCTDADKLIDSILLPADLEDPSTKKVPLPASNFISFENVSSTSLTLVLAVDNNSPKSQELLGYSLWHRKADAKSYPAEPTGTSDKLKRKFPVLDLCPATEYCFKVIAFGNTSELGSWEVRTKTKLPSNDVQSNGSAKTNSSEISNSLVGADESNNTSLADTKDTEQEETPLNSDSGLDEDPISINESHRDSSSDEQNHASDVPKSENESNTQSNTPIGNEIVVVASLPVTPSRVEANKPSPSNNILDNGSSKPEKDPGSSSKKRTSEGKHEDLSIRDGSSSAEGDYEYCVKVIRWLECKKHIDTNFRTKFLTWFSLRASPQEKRIVSAFVETLLDDPGSLAGQLMDTFSEAVNSKRPPSAPTGFCMKLWH